MPQEHRGNEDDEDKGEPERRQLARRAVLEGKTVGQFGQFGQMLTAAVKSALDEG